MIEMDSDEQLNSFVSDRTLRMVLLFCGQKVKDKLLYRDDDAHDRLFGTRSPNARIRSLLGIGHRHNSSGHQDKGREA